MLVNLLLMRGNRAAAAPGSARSGAIPMSRVSERSGSPRSRSYFRWTAGRPIRLRAAARGWLQHRSKPASSAQDEVRAFIMLGGNFVRAIPDHGQMEPAWRRIRLTVNESSPSLTAAHC